tara:strand:- start:1337 stop:1504 length:168 start_codon:yes stop_codon:yes gene_type:complete
LIPINAKINTPLKATVAVATPLFAANKVKNNSKDTGVKVNKSCKKYNLLRELAHD